MALKEWNINVGQSHGASYKSGSVTAVSGGATTLSGPVVRLLVDDAVTGASKQEVLRILLEVLQGQIFTDTFPPA